MHAGYLLFSLQVDAARVSLRRSIDAVVDDLGDSDPTLGGLYNDLSFVEQVAGQSRSLREQTTMADADQEALLGGWNGPSLWDQRS